jgi:hypothetical protein
VPLLMAAAAATGIDLTAIGSIDRAHSEATAYLVDDDGSAVVVEKAGWTHS